MGAGLSSVDARDNARVIETDRAAEGVQKENHEQPVAPRSISL